MSWFAKFKRRLAEFVDRVDARIDKPAKERGTFTSGSEQMVDSDMPGEMGRRHLESALRLRARRLAATDEKRVTLRRFGQTPALSARSGPNRAQSNRTKSAPPQARNALHERGS